MTRELKIKTFYLLERKAKEGDNIPIGMSPADGSPVYCENWRQAVWFVRRIDAQKFQKTVENHGLTVYEDMLPELTVEEHQMGE